MKRNVIKIHEDKCVGCGLCVNACQEGAIQLIDGKAKLVSESYCDGLGNCLPSCPTDAIELIEKEADAFDKEAAHKHKEETQEVPELDIPPLACGCPGTQSKSFTRAPKTAQVKQAPVQGTVERPQSELQQWPVQIKLVPPTAPYLQDSHLLIAADCSAFAYGDFHNEFMKNKVTIVGCPKLDEGDYTDRFTEILVNNNIKSVTIVRMEVPCCGGIENAAKQALMNCGKMIPWQVVTISTDGRILDI